MEIKVLGTGCAKCKASADLITRVAGETGKDVTIEKVADMRAIVAYGLMATSVGVIGRKVAKLGTVPSHDPSAVW